MPQTTTSSETFSSSCGSSNCRRHAAAAHADSNEFLEPASERISSVAARLSEELSINKLRFSKVGLVGRKEEITKLKECANRCCATKKEDGGRTSSTSTREFVLISGKSGTGKTALAKSLLPKEEASNGSRQPLFLFGKFDQLLRDEVEPYAGISSACKEFCGQLLMLRDSDRAEEPRHQRYRDIIKDIQQNLGNDVIITLSRVIPEFLEVFDDITPDDLQESSMQNYENDDNNQRILGFANKESKNRILFFFRKLFETITTSVYWSHICLTLDDLQWADLASLEQVENILMNDSIHSLLVIGCYRSDEVNDTHMLSQTLRSLKGVINNNNNREPNNEEFTRLAGNKSQSSKIFLQVLLELSGDAEPIILEDPTAFPGYEQFPPTTTRLLEQFQNRLCAIFGNHYRGAKVSIQRGNNTHQENVGHIWHVTDPLFRGISLFDQARTTGKWKYRRLARKQYSTIKRLCRKGNPNVSHHIGCGKRSP